jgi:DNA polymerase V
MVFPESTSDTSLMIKTAAYCLKQIFIPNLIYFKAGILLDGLENAAKTQTDLFHKPDFEENEKLMGVMDAINKAHGRNMVHLGSMGIKQGWAMRQENKSQRFTTSWGELPVVK